MGKGQRARDARAQDKITNPQKYTAKKKKKNLSWITPVVLVCIVLVVAAVFVMNYLNENGILERRKVVMESEHFQITGTMLQYASMTTYQNFAYQYKDYLTYFGLDTSKKLSSQEYGDGTWYDYFKESAVEMISEALVYAEGAVEAGVELDEEDLNDIEESIALLSEYASSYGYTEKAYIATLYGTGVSKDDIREYSKIASLATKYENMLRDDEEASLSADDVEGYYKANLNTYTYADVIYYTDTLILSGELTDEEREEQKKNFRESFAGFEAATSADEFNASVPPESVDDPDTPAGETTETSITYSEISMKEAADWVFETENDEFVRTAGEIKIFEEYNEGSVDEEGNVSDSNYAVSAYYIVSTPDVDHSMTKNVGHILFKYDSYDSDEAAKAKAEEVYNEFLAGDMTKESFEALGKKYTDDSNVFYENVEEGVMVEEFNDWLFDPARTVGETAVISTADYGYHIMYFDGDGYEKWYKDCLDAAVAENVANIYSEMTEKYSVTVHEKVVDSVRE